MRVFNLTSNTVDYRGRLIAPNGGSVEIAELTYVGPRDQSLQEGKILAFGSLPSWWFPPNLIVVPPVIVKDEPVAVEEEIEEPVDLPKLSRINKR